MFFFFKFYLFVYFCLFIFGCAVSFIAVCRLSLVVESKGYSLVAVWVFSLWWFLLL